MSKPNPNAVTALYARVSTDRQSTGLEAQVRALEEHCRAKGISNYKLFVDENVSGTKASRPGLNHLMDAVKDGDVNTVIVYSFSRFARSTKHLIGALELFQASDVGFVSITENVDTSSAMGRALFTILSAISQLERDLIAERVRNGLANARAKGVRLGRARTRNGPLIRELAARGISYREISRLAKCSQGSIADELREARSETVVVAVPERNRMLG